MRLLALTLLTATAVYAQDSPGQWVRLPESPEAVGRFDDGFFVSPDTGWAAGLTFNHGAPTVYATTDGGATWEARGQLSVKPRSTGFATAELGWFGILTPDPDQLLFETRDGGYTLTNITDRIQGDAILGICGISVVNPQVVYAAGWCCGGLDGGAAIIKTTDGGQTWHSTRLDDLADFLIDVHFFNEKEGVAVGGTQNGIGRAVVIGTTDGGNTWSIRHVSADDGEWAWKISFPTRAVGYVSVESGSKVLKTTDGGLTWEDVPDPIIGSLQGVGFATPDLGWTSGHSTRSVTMDGGTTWEVYTGELDFVINRFRMLSDTLGYAFGRFVYKYTAGTGVATEPPPPPAPPLVTVYPNPSSARVSFTFALPEPDEVDLAIYDPQGRRLATVVQRRLAAGEHAVVWEERDGGPHRLPSGTYLYRLTTSRGQDGGSFVWVRR